MNMVGSVWLALALSCVLSPGIAAAQQDACTDFEVKASHEHRKVAHVDRGEVGPDLGDRRFGVRNLVDADGKIIGRFRWLITMISPEGDAEEARLTSYYLILDNGTLIGERINEPASSMSDTSTVSNEPGEAAILGGTGDYRGARGVIRVRFEDDAPHTVLLDVDFVC